MIRRIHPADGRGEVWVTVEVDGQPIDMPLDDVPVPALMGYVGSGGLARDAAPIAASHAVGGLFDWLFGGDDEDDDWQSEWREKVHGWIRDSQLRDKAWLNRQRQAEFAGRADLVARAADWRDAHKRLQNWMYEVIDLALGGVEALGLPAAVAIPVFKYAIAGVVAVVTVHKVAAFFETDEVKGAEFDNDLITVAERMIESDDPQVRASGGQILETVSRTRETRAENDDDGFGIVIGAGLVVIGLVAWRRRKALADAAQSAVGRLKR